MKISKETPLLYAINEYRQKGITGFHTPGHQQGQGCEMRFQSLMKNSFSIDLTELPGLDNLRMPEGCLKESQSFTAKLFNACKTFYLVNGSTLGLQAALLAVSRPGKKVVVTRNAHVSVVNGLILSGGIPVLTPVHIDLEWGLPLGVRAEKIIEAKNEYPHADLILLTHPEYQGTGIDLAPLIRQLKSSATLIVDEAHGAHLYFQEMVPLSAQKEKPDIVIHSAHKTLAVLTQASMLHVNNLRWVEPLQTALNMLQTTSPSYLLLSSLDGMQEQMRTQGHDLVKGVLEIAQAFRSAVHNLQGYRLFVSDEEMGCYLDKTKVLLSAADLGLTGWELSRILYKEYGIAVEMSDYFYVLFLFHPGHSYDDIAKTVLALTDIRKYRKDRALAPLSIPTSLLKDNTRPLLAPRTVYYSTSELVRLEEAGGRIAARVLTVYPPGIPLVWPGEVYQREHIEYIQSVAGQQVRVEGLSSGCMVSVLSEG